MSKNAGCFEKFFCHFGLAEPVNFIIFLVSGWQKLTSF